MTKKYVAPKEGHFTITPPSEFEVLTHTPILTNLPRVQKYVFRIGNLQYYLRDAETIATGKGLVFQSIEHDGYNFWNAAKPIPFV